MQKRCVDISTTGFLKQPLMSKKTSFDINKNLILILNKAVYLLMKNIFLCKLNFFFFFFFPSFWKNTPSFEQSGDKISCCL